MMQKTIALQSESGAGEVMSSEFDITDSTRNTSHQSEQVNTTNCIVSTDDELGNLLEQQGEVEAAVIMTREDDLPV